MKSCWAVVVAAGRGVRTGLNVNKALRQVAGRSVLRRSLDALEASGVIDGAVLVLAEGDRQAYADLTLREGESALVRRVVTGGATRQQSVLSGLRAVPEDIGWVAIHDAARAMTPRDVIVGAVESARAHGSGVAATVINDTVKRVDGEGRSVGTIPRETLRAVQTPQVFERLGILSAHVRALEDGYQATDDAALMEKYVGPVHLVVAPGGDGNKKLTTAKDLRRMERMLTGDLRIGFGQDAHRLVPGRALVLGGVQVEHETGLIGHSDADVATHALMDALLGAAGLGDIGRHFPDTDERYKGASSIALLSDVARLLSRAGLLVVNCDVTIVAQKPKLAPYMDRMRENFARVLEIDASFVNVKATTTERMGYEGREEGISASAVALVGGPR